MVETAQQDRLSVQVNGETVSVRAGCSIAAMLMEIGIDPKRVAVEHNLEVVPRSTLDGVPVAQGDSFEIVHFVGGG